MENVYHFIKKYKVTPIIFLLLISIFGRIEVFGQTVAPSVNITVTITPPYSPFYSDYAGPNASKVLLIVQNLSNTQKSIKLTGQLQGDNGIRISTKSNYVPLQPIILAPNETKQLNGLALKDIFDLNTLNVYGIDKVKLVQTSRLPEGNYTFCIQAVDMANNQILSANAPMGCSTLSIIYPDAPVLINPLSNTTVPGFTGLSFVWLNNVTQTFGITYKFQIAEMPSNVKTDPNQIFNSTSFVKIEKFIANSTSTVLLPSDAPLEIGKRYAWRVIAEDPTGKIVFKNKGVSAASEFRYGEKSTILSTLMLNKPEVDEGIEKMTELMFNWTFTDNTSQNDNVGFYGGNLGKTSNLTTSKSKYELYINKLKSVAERHAEQKARDEKLLSLQNSLQKSSNIADITKKASIYNEIQQLQRTSLTIFADKGIVVSVDKDNIDYKSSAAIAAYLKDGNDYQWSVKNIATGVVSASRNFMLRGLDGEDYKLSLAGNLRYNFRDQYIAGAVNRAKQKNEVIAQGQTSKIILTEEERGYPLAKKNFQVLRVTFLAPVKQVIDSLVSKENGVEKLSTVTRDRIDPISDLSVTYASIQKENNTEFVAGGVTDNNGNFDIAVPVRKAQFKIIDPNVVLKGKKYALVQGLVIKVADNRFSDPNWFVTPYDAGTIVNLGESTVQIFDYKAEANLVVDGDTYTNEGKLYLLRKEQNLVRGEVQNMGPTKKDIPMYISQTFNGPLTAPMAFTSNFNVVGVSDIKANAYTKNAPPIVFNKLVASANSADDYSLYFEPSSTKDALYFSPQKISNLGGKKVSYEGTDFANRDIVEKVSFKAKFITMKISGRYVYSWKNKPSSKLPLPEGTVLKLVKGDLPQRSAGMDEPEFTNESLITTTVVQKNGEYTFDVGMKDYDDFNKTTGADISVAIVSRYYYADPVSINRNAKKNITMPELTATVRQFSFTSRVSYIDASVVGGETRYPSPMDIYLCRLITETAPIDRPKNEGGADRGTWPKKIYELKDQYGNVTARYNIVNKTQSDSKGIFKFDGLIAPNTTDENYHVFAEPLANSQDNFQSIDDYTVIRDWDKNNLAKIKKGTFSNEQYITEINFTAPLKPWISLHPMAPVIDGAVYPRSDASTTVLTKVFVEMFDMPSSVAGNLSDEGYAKELIGKTANAQMTTGENGRFIFDKIRVQGDKIIFNGKEIRAGVQPWKLLRFTKQGFLPTYYPVNSGKPLARGQVDPNSRKIFMNLPKTIYVTVVNSNKEKIPARIIVGEDFSWMDYSPNNSADKNTAKSPEGDVKFTIIPIDRANYKTTTVTAKISPSIITKTVGFITTKTSAPAQYLEFEVKKIEHSITVYCYKKGTTILLPANVTVLNTSSFKEKKETDIFGLNPRSIITIPSGGTQFDLKVVPTDVNYTIAKTQVLSNGLNGVEVKVYVEPAVSVKVKGLEVYGNFQSKALNGDFNAYVQGFDEDEYVVSKSELVVYSPPKIDEVIVVPKTNTPLKDIVIPPPPAPVKVPVVVPKPVTPVVLPKPTKPIKIIKLGVNKKAISEEVETYLSALAQGDNTNYITQPDGSTPSKNYNDVFYTDEKNTYNLDEVYNETIANNMFSERIVTITISRLPANSTFVIAGTKTDFIGSTASINPKGVNNTNAELLFWKAPDVNVNSMYGFPIELTQLYQPGATGQYKISGRLKLGANSQTSNLKSKATSDELEFKEVLVNVNKVNSGNPKDNYFTLANNMVFNQNSIDAKLFGNFEVKVIANKNGISLLPQSSKTASIIGKVALDPSSLSKGVTTSQSGQLGNANYMYLNKKTNRTATEVYNELTATKTSNDFQTFSTSKSDLTEPSYFISTQNGTKPTFYGADAMQIIPDQNGITLTSTWISFVGNVQTNLANTTGTTTVEKLIGANINAKGTFILKSGDFSSYGSEKMSVKLKNWDLNIDSWTYGTTGFNAFGSLNALGLTIPFSDLNIFKDRIGFGTFDVKQLKLLNTFKIDLKASETSVSFGFDKGFSSLAGAWSVSVLANTEAAVASIKGLPDLAVADEIQIKNISLYDTDDPNDTRIILDEKQKDVTLNGIAKFRPGSIAGSSKHVTFRGDLNMDIPGFTGLEAVTYDLKYEIDSANSGKLIHVDDKPFANLGLDTKGITVKFDGAQTFRNGRLELNGVLKDKDLLASYEIPVKLVKTLVNNVASTTLTATENKIYLNKHDKSTFLDKASGSSLVNSSNQWDYFKFGGDLTTTDATAGIKPSPMAFEIKGEVIANSSKLGISNMDAGPMTGFSIAYDFNEKALIGSGHLSQNLKFAQLELDAELKIGNVTDWYIMASGKASIAHMPIFKDIGVAFMVGNTIISDSQRSGFYKHFSGNIKPSDQTLSTFNGRLTGILFMGSLELKLPLVPTINIDLAPIASVQFDNGLYAATFFKLNFADKPQITVGGRVGAYVKLSAGASVGLACAGVSLGAEANAEIVGSMDTGFNFAAMLALNFQLQGSAYVGVGLCTSSCSTIKFLGVSSPIKCYRKQYSKVLTIGVQAKLSNDGLSLTGSGQTQTEN